MSTELNNLIKAIENYNDRIHRQVIKTVSSSYTVTQQDSGAFLLAQDKTNIIIPILAIGSSIEVLAMGDGVTITSSGINSMVLTGCGTYLTKGQAASIKVIDNSGTYYLCSTASSMVIPNSNPNPNPNPDPDPDPDPKPNTTNFVWLDTVVTTGLTLSNNNKTVSFVATRESQLAKMISKQYARDTDSNHSLSNRYFEIVVNFPTEKTSFMNHIGFQSLPVGPSSINSAADLENQDNGGNFIYERLVFADPNYSDLKDGDTIQFYIYFDPTENKYKFIDGVNNVFKYTDIEMQDPSSWIPAYDNVSEYIYLVAGYASENSNDVGPTFTIPSVNEYKYKPMAGFTPGWPNESV